MKLKNIFLTVSLIAFAIGFSDGGESTFWYMGRPVGAILFMLFMIFNLLEKETALLNQQSHSRKENLNQPGTKRVSSGFDNDRSRFMFPKSLRGTAK